jgi:hypothetical protein
MFFLKDAPSPSATVELKKLKIYGLGDIEITGETGSNFCKRNRFGRFIEANKAPSATPGLSDNHWHINFTGDGLTGLRNVIKELLTNDIYKMVLGYSPNTLILYDTKEKSFCRVSRNIENSKMWGGEYTPYAMDGYLGLSDGTVHDSKGTKKSLFGLASIAIVAFLLGEGDMYSEQYMLQEDDAKLSVWKIDNEYSFSCKFPITLENLQKLPLYQMPRIGISKQHMDAYIAKKSAGLLSEDELCQVSDKGTLYQFNMYNGLPRGLVESKNFQDEKTATFRKLIDSQAIIDQLLDYYCDLSNHDLEALQKYLRIEDYVALPQMLSDMKIWPMATATTCPSSESISGCAYIPRSATPTTHNLALKSQPPCYDSTQGGCSLLLNIS